MNLQRLWTILRKDLVDAIRDGRVLAVILIPIALGVFYGLIYPDEEPRPTATVVVVGSSADADRIATTLPRDVSRALELKIERASDAAEAKTTVADDDADIAVVVPDGYLAAASGNGAPPPLQAFIGTQPSPSAQAVANLLPATVDRLAERPPGSALAVETVEPVSQSAFDALGMRTFFVIAAVVMLLGFIGMLATPIILAEEIEKRTIEALLLAARGSEVLTAKALVGLIYSAVASAITILATGITIERPGLFLLGAAGLAISVVGLGLGMAYLFRSADKLNTWGWVLLMPLLIPAFLVSVDGSQVVDIIVQATPTGQGMRLMVDGALSSDVFGGVGLALAVFVVWGGGGMLVLGRLLQTRGS
ncbi:MAG: ABC transporter permease [Patulibacter sp.]